MSRDDRVGTHAQRRAAAAVLALLVAATSALLPAAAASERVATLIQLDGAIGPAMSHYIQGAITDADAQNASVIILQMDTPGGLDTSMRAIIKAILGSPVPVVGYVAPNGARAASAGTYILYACAFAAMAPATNLGAATPISLGGEEPVSAPTPSTPGPSTPAPSAAPKPARSTPLARGRAAPATTAPASPVTPAQASPAPSTASDRKAVNDAVAYIRSLAQLHGRNAQWAESAVRGAASLPARDALEQHVIDFIAPDVPDLLRQLNGRRVQIAGQERVLHTEGLSVQRVQPDWRTQLLVVLSHPTLAYGLLLAGIWGLMLEGLHPGAVLPGVVGALALLLALYGLELLEVNFAGVALMALGVGLITTEFFMPTYGSLGVGGLAAFVIGSIILFDHNSAGLHVALPLIAGVAIAGALVIAAIAALAARARRRPVSTGAEAMIGDTVEVVSGSADHCVVRYGGELWNAHASRPLHAGQRARIIKVAGLTLWIEPQPSASSE